MPVRVFTEEEKLNIKEKLLSVGFPLLKEYGVIHMSVPKIAKAAEIGTGTFYRFFESKEDYLYQLIQYRRKKLIESKIPSEVINGQRTLTREEVRGFIELIADRSSSVYANMNLEDEAMLNKKLSLIPDIEHEKQVSAIFFRWIGVSGAKKDFAVLANMMKILAISSQARAELHEEGYDKTIELLIDIIMKLIYEDR